MAETYLEIMKDLADSTLLDDIMFELDHNSKTYVKASDNLSSEMDCSEFHCC